MYVNALYTCLVLAEVREAADPLELELSTVIKTI